MSTDPRGRTIVFSAEYTVCDLLRSIHAEMPHDVAMNRAVADHIWERGCPEDLIKYLARLFRENDIDPVAIIKEGEG